MKNPISSKVTGLLVIAITVASLAFAAIGMTAVAAQGALPGDALYAVKTGMEQTRLSFTRSETSRASLDITYANRRLDEMVRLADQARYAELGTALKSFQAHTGRAAQAIAGTSVSVQSDRLKAQYAGALLKQAAVMQDLAASLPPAALASLQSAAAAPAAAMAPAQPAFMPASLTSATGTVEAITTTAWTISGVEYAVDAMTQIEGIILVGDMVEFHYFTDAAGLLTLSKVKLTLDDNTNSNTNDNSNGNGNGNGNGNTNDNGNTNGNENEDMEEGEQYGTVEAISATSWTISGVTYLVDANTRIEGSIIVGDWVEIHYYTDASGALVLSKVELEDDHDDNQNGNTNGNTNGNSNEDHDDDHGSNSNSNGNSNEDDDDDDHGSNSNGNSNDHDDDDDDDHGGNHNEDHDD